MHKYEPLKYKLFYILNSRYILCSNAILYILYKQNIFLNSY